MSTCSLIYSTYLLVKLWCLLVKSPRALGSCGANDGDQLRSTGHHRWSLAGHGTAMFGGLPVAWTTGTMARWHWSLRFDQWIPWMAWMYITSFRCRCLELFGLVWIITYIMFLAACLGCLDFAYFHSLKGKLSWQLLKWTESQPEMAMVTPHWRLVWFNMV